MATFESLCETLPDENCVLTSREIFTEVRGNGYGTPNDTPRQADREVFSQKYKSSLSRKMSVNHPHCKHDDYYSFIGIIGYIMI